MKWFLAANQISLGDRQFFDQVKVAVLSARKYTELEPCLIYDGDSCLQLDWFASQGVRILSRKLSFYQELERYVLVHFNEWYLQVRAGAFLRMEIPIAMKLDEIEDEFIVYTDCDVCFVRDVDFSLTRPKVLAACGRKQGGRTRFRIGGTMHYNSGVMVMNVHAMRKEYDEFKEFVLNNGFDVSRPKLPFLQKNLFMSDQVAINLYFEGRIDRLDQEYNWHPSEGINRKARIVHFNGLKWTQWQDYAAGILPTEIMAKYAHLVDRDRRSYEHYCALAMSMLI